MTMMMIIVMVLLMMIMALKDLLFYYLEETTDIGGVDSLKAIRRTFKQQFVLLLNVRVVTNLN